MSCILLIDDDPAVRSLTSLILTSNGYEVLTASNGIDGLKLVSAKRPQLVITDYHMSGMSGLDVLLKIKEIDQNIPVIILTAYGDPSLTIKSIQTGAYDFIEKPLKPKELLEITKKVLQKSAIEDISEEEEVFTPTENVSKNIMVGKTPEMREIFKNIGKITQNNVNLMITGENGTGKKRLAKLVHFSSFNSESPIHYFNCRILDSQDSESEIQESHPENEPGLDYLVSKLKTTGNGTIILDGISAMNRETQHKVLNILNKLDFDLIDSNKNRPRIISLSDQDVGKLVQENLFSNELYFRLKVFSIHIPPLRNRKEDVQILTDHLIKEINPLLNKQIGSVDDSVYRVLLSHDWPGNIKELKNVLIQALLLSNGLSLEKKDIRIDGVLSSEKGDINPDNIKMRSLDEIEKEYILSVLNATGWNKQLAMSILGITRPTINAKIEKYGLNRE